MASSREPSSVSTGTSSGATGLRRFGYAIASLPFVLTAIAMIVAPGFMEPIFANPPEIVGLPLGVIVLFFVAIWAALAFVVIRAYPSPWIIALSFLAFTVPAIVAIFFLPATILIIQNLGP
jgi:hypothetical protein